MIYLFTGDDAKNKILSYEKFIKSLPKGGDKFSVSRNNFDKIQIESLYSGSSLFSAKAAVIFSGILENEETLELIGESTSDFIFLEGKLNKPILDAFKKVGPKRLQMNVFELPKEKKEKFNNFLLA